VNSFSVLNFWYFSFKGKEYKVNYLSWYVAIIAGVLSKMGRNEKRQPE